MKTLLIVILTGSLVIGTLLNRVREGVRIVRPEVVETQKQDKQNVPVMVTPEAIPTFPPLPLATPACDVFVDKDCFKDLRPSIQ